MLEAKQGRTLNGIALGPSSPVLPDPAPRQKPSRSGEGARQQEHRIQVALFERVNDPAEQLRRPALALVHAVPNGASASSQAAAARRRAEGQKPGVPDINCPVARGGHFGLWIELKRPGGTTSPAQASWLAQLGIEGYRVALHTTEEGAWAELVNYLDQPRTAPAAQNPIESQTAR
jgi:VRR-NUC domain.